MIIIKFEVTMSKISEDTKFMKYILQQVKSTFFSTESNVKGFIKHSRDTWSKLKPSYKD